MDYLISFFSTIKPYLGYLLSIATFLLGRWWGRKDAYRSERNKAAEPVHIGVMSHIGMISQKMNVRIPVTQSQIDTLCWHSSKSDASKIRSAWAEYKAVESEAGDEYQSNPRFRDWDKFISAAEKVATLSGKK